MTATLPERRRAKKRIVVPAALAVSAAVVAGSVLAASPASASPHAEHGRFGSAWQSTITHKIHVWGYAYDAASPHSSVKVAVYVNGKWLKSMTANGASPKYDKAQHIHGRHGFQALLKGPRKARTIRLVVHGAGNKNGSRVTDTRSVGHRSPKADRIVTVAQRYVGSRYSYGADGPHAFDCSGYSKFVYKKAGIAKLPHNSQSQRNAKHMHYVKRSSARAGDLVFYLSGGSAYHVSIYAGHGMQYSATNPRRGVEHSKISSSNVVFKSDWH